MSTLAERMSEALKESGMTQRELARACGVSPASVNNWLSGQTKSLKAATAHRAAEALKVSALWLSEGIGPKQRTKTSPETYSSAPVSPPPIASDVVETKPPTSRTEREDRIARILALIAQMNDFGVGALLERAKDLAREHPSVQKAAS